MLQVSLGRYLVQGRMLLVNVGTSTYPLLTHDMLLASNISHKLIVTNLKSTV